jgi:hypothetical protein
MKMSSLKSLETFKKSSLSKIDQNSVNGGSWKAVKGSGTCDPDGNSSYLVRQYILGIPTDNYDTKTDYLGAA